MRTSPNCAKKVKELQHQVVSILQKTLKTRVSCEGVGVHSGTMAKMTLCPAPQDTGYVFIRTDVPRSKAYVNALVKNVTSTQLGTNISNAHGVNVQTVEHVLAALFGLGIDNCYIEIDGPEVPIMDGSSQPFIDLIIKSGVRMIAAPKRSIEILETVEVVSGDKFARLEPFNGFELDVSIEFPSKIIGKQRGVYNCARDGFANDLASARTFGFMHQVEEMRSKGLSLGGSLDNAVVIDGDTILNVDGLRYNDEFVRHKALDAVGDLSLCGAGLIGRYVSYSAGHAMNNLLVKELMNRPDAWRMSFTPLDTQILAAAGI